MFFYCTIYGQTNNKRTIDSLSKLDYEILFDTINKELYSSKTLIYAKAYTKKAQISKDTTNTIIGYYYQSLKATNKYELLDSLIYLSKKIDNHNFITVGYYDKAIEYYNKRDFKSALDNYIKAYDNNDGSNKEYLGFLIENGIASLKSRINYDEEALILFKKNLKYVLKNNFKEEEPNKYFDVLASLSHSYRKNNLLDSAYYYNKKGLMESKEAMHYYDYNHFVLNDGVLSFFKRNYTNAIDSINKSLPYIIKNNDLPNLAVGHFYLGKIKLLKGKEDEAIDHFIKVDSVFTINKDLLPELKENYILIKKIYKEKKDLINELKYLERLILIDSILDANYKVLSKRIAKHYDNNDLLKEKEQLSLLVKKNNKNYTILVAIVCLTIIALLIFILYVKQKNKQRLKQLLGNKSNIFEERENIQMTSTKKKSITINPEIVEDLLIKLELFENNKDFTLNTVNLNDLSNQFGTNPKYLSKVINYNKQKNFSNYLNDLRIKYAIDKLKEDKQFRLYTIKAIANEVGFNSTESFSKAFFKITKLKPSSFLKELNKKDV